MKIRIEITETELRELINSHLRLMTNLQVASKDIRIEVKSKQNYRSEWEPADFRAVAEVG